MQAFTLNICRIAVFYAVALPDAPVQARDDFPPEPPSAIPLTLEDYVPFSGAPVLGEPVDPDVFVRTCDETAAHPDDARKPDDIDGVFGSRLNVAIALPACLNAAALAPGNARILYQLARVRLAAGQTRSAVEAFKALAETDTYAAAMTALGTIYHTGKGAAKDEREAERWYRMAAENGEIRAMAVLGWLHQSGSGVPKDNAKAFKWYHRAAEGGSPSGMYNLAFMYENGWGVTVDSAEAAKWFGAAAAAGHPPALTMTGWIYQIGRGVERDLAQSFKWYMQGATHRQPSAMGALGGLYDSGVPGIERSPERAAYWLIEGLRLGNETTYKRLTRLSRTLHDDTRRAIQSRLQELGFDPGPVDGLFGAKTRQALDRAFHDQDS